MPTDCRVAAVLAAALLSACAAAPLAQDTAGTGIPLHAHGKEPVWSLRIDQSLRFESGDLHVSGPAVPVQVEGERRLYAAALRDRAIAVSVEVVAEPVLCRIVAGGLPYPQRVTVAIDGRRFAGCGGEPAALLQGGEWRVKEIAGERVGEAVPTLRFAADGRLGGHASCNRFQAGYTLAGDSLLIGRGAATRMACPPPQMVQEQRFLEFLDGVRRFDIDADGSLLLIDGDGRRLRAHR